MRMEVSKWFHFEAAHSLPHLPFTHKCSRVHGHSYKVKVVCAGEVDPAMGWVIDYADISKVVNTVIKAIDHNDLNQIFNVPPRPTVNETTGKPMAPDLGHRTKPSTAENLAKWFFDQLKPSLPLLVEIRVRETASTEVVYRFP